MPPTLTTGKMRAQYLWPGPRIAQHNRRFLGSHILRKAAIRYVVGMIVERTFRETRTEKNFQKGATIFQAGAFVALTIGFLFRPIFSISDPLPTLALSARRLNWLCSMMPSLTLRRPRRGAMHQSPFWRTQSRPPSRA